jgi:membrane glycosyltransferase
LIGLVWAGFVYWLNPSFLWWLLPVAGALALSIPISVFSSRVSLGRRARAARLFLIPEESMTPRELRRMRAYVRQAPPVPGFVDAVVDPLHNAMACASDIARTRHSESVRKRHRQLADRALAHGPAALDAYEKNALLGDAIALSHLHYDAWSANGAHPSWKAASEIVYEHPVALDDITPTAPLNLSVPTIAHAAPPPSSPSSKLSSS